MIETLTVLLQEALTSPWVYLALFAAATLDGPFPVVPSESLVISAGVFAVSGSPNLLAVVAVAAAGAFVGDHLCYLVGRTGGARLAARMPTGSRRRAAFDVAARNLQVRGGLLLVAGRFVPGMRTATTVTAGAVGYPLRRFSAFDLLGAVTWAVYCVSIGIVGGVAFEQDPLLGAVSGIAGAMALTAVVELLRMRGSRGWTTSRPLRTSPGAPPPRSTRRSARHGTSGSP